MAAERTQLTELVREWCAKHPDIPHMTLARMFVTAFPDTYKSIDTCRLAIQRERGVRPKGNRRGGGPRLGPIADPVTYTGEVSRTKFCFRAPKSEAEPYGDFIIHGAQRVLRLSDIHYPFHDERALDAAINYGINMDPTVLLLAGDVVDLPDFSRHPKLDRKSFVEREMLIVTEQFAQFRAAFPKARIVWMEGNHEQRVKKYVMEKAPALFGIPMLDVPGLVCAYGGVSAMQGVEWVDDCRTVRTGKMAHLHGHEYRGGGGVKPARSLYLKAGESTTIGHFHKTDNYTKVQLDGSLVECLVTGCLSTLNPDWMRKTEWNYGFASYDVGADGRFEARNHRIIDGKVR